MSRILALDLGDAWVGTALSDPLGITCRPYQTVKTGELNAFLTKAIPAEEIATIVVGHPKTLTGTSSDQTKRVEAMQAELAKQFPAIVWVWVDERLSSRRAITHQQQVKNQKRSAQSKQEVHSIAAAFLLQVYLDTRAW